MHITKLDDIVKSAIEQETKILACANPTDPETLEALREAETRKIVHSILVGKKAEIEKVAKQENIPLFGFDFVEEPDQDKTAQVCVDLIKKGKAHIFMKGQIKTSAFARAALRHESDFLANKLVSHVGIIETQYYHKLLGITDVAINIAPSFEEMKTIIDNAVSVLKCIGIKKPKIAVISAVETVNPKIPSTVLADQLKKYGEEGKFTDCIVDGPMDIYLALDPNAKIIKNYESAIAGDVDLLLVPTIEVGNTIYKTIVSLGKGVIAGIVVGTKGPMVLTSRADSHESKLYSLALGALSAK